MAHADPISIALDLRHELLVHLYAALERDGRFGCRVGDTLAVFTERYDALMLKASHERTAEHAARSVTKYLGLAGYVGTSDTIAEYTRGPPCAFRRAHAPAKARFGQKALLPQENATKWLSSHPS